MGVKNLWDILESCKKTVPLHHLQNKRVCIDLSCWIVQLHNVNKTHCAMKEKLYLSGLFHRVRALIALNCSVIFVADGSIPAIKLSTYRRRLNQGNEVSQEENIPHKQSSLKRNMGSEFSCMIKEAKLLGGALGIPCLDGIEEAEAQCALLNSESLCDGCFTSDSDAFLFGARTVYRDICLGEGGYIVCYEMDDIEKKLGFGRNSLIALALLLGSDYNPGVQGIGPDTACRIVKSVGESDILQRITLEGLSFVKKPKASKKQGKSFTSDTQRNGHNLDEVNLCMRVFNAYLKPKCHSTDSYAVNRVVGLYPFDRIQLHRLCTQYFDWPIEKTDEYILPKIAERDLRRYDNLRGTSSELGVCLSMNECPINEILKLRKLQGRDCFEVSWEKLDGLESSIVPADLVQSACPEKIIEFQDRKAQAKKPKNRKSKPKPKITESERDASLKEINLKLDELLLEIERDTLVSGSALENISNRRNEPEIDRNKGRDARVVNKDTEVIDLLSPSPKLLVRKVSKVQETGVRCIDVIDLSESENEVSPGFEKKARDLRLFIANIL